MGLQQVPFPLELTLAAIRQGLSSLLQSSLEGKCHQVSSGDSLLCWALLPTGAAWPGCSGSIKTCD